MRLHGLGVTFAAIAFSVGHAVACAQAPAEPGSASRTGTTLRDWFTSAAREMTGAGGQAAGDHSQIPVHYLRQTTCNIPFTVDTSQGAPVELQLFVSTDQGQRWMFFSRTNPGTGSFTFRATQDGEYWFALKTIDKSPTPTDAKSFQPGLKVVFDTQPPRLDFAAGPQGPGIVAVRWDAQDPNLDRDSIRIEYQAEPQGAWQTLSIPQASGGAGRQLAGHQLFKVEGAATSVLVRAEVRDKAGNNTVMSRQVETARGAGAIAAAPASTGSVGSPAAAGPQTMGDGSVAWPRNNEMPPRASTPPPATYGELPPPRPSAEFPPPSVSSEVKRNPYFATASQTNSAELPRPGDSQGPETVPAGRREPPTGSAGYPRPDPSAFSGARSVSQPSAQPSAPGPVDPPLPTPPASGVQGATVDPPATDFNPARPESADPAVTLPGGDRPRMTNSREFSLDYEVEALGPSAIQTVELWGTSDGGRTWTRWQADEDRQSPVDVQVERDGVYGFRIVIVSTRQLTGLRPQPGEPADIWIGVDTTPPSVRITAAPYGEGEHAGQFDIRWQAFDTGFGDRPLTLSFSENPDGPWNIIAAGLANSGQYYWTVEPRIPREIYLRLEAHDDAGNVGEHRITEPIKTAGLVPHAKIRGFRVPSATNRSAARNPSQR